MGDDDVARRRRAARRRLDQGLRRRRRRGHTALGRHAVVDDSGPVIASILRDDNHWVNGQRIEAAGGVHL